MSQRGFVGKYNASTSHKLTRTLTLQGNLYHSLARQALQERNGDFIDYTLGLPRDFTLKPGVHYEHTAIVADFSQGPMGKTPDYDVLVPNVNVLRKLANGNVLKLAYNRRIQRLSLQFLNPNLLAANPLIQTQGNSVLGPERTNNYKLSYSTLLKQANLNFTAFARNTSGSIQSVRTPLGDTDYPGVVCITYADVGQEGVYGGNAFASLDWAPSSASEAAWTPTEPCCATTGPT